MNVAGEFTVDAPRDVVFRMLSDAGWSMACMTLKRLTHNTATSVTTLEQVDAQTRVTYSVVSTLAGKFGSIGQPILRAKAKDMEKQFAARLSAVFALAL